MATTEPDRSPADSLDPSLTLNEIVTRHPEAHGILTGYGFDTCCGGARTLAEEAARLRLDAEEVLDRIGAR